MQDAIEKIKALLMPLIDGTDMYITNIKIKPTNNIKIFMDADTGFSISKCSSINKKLYAAITEAGLYPDGDFSLEVSSPGIDEPLKDIRQYQKNTGRTLEVTPIEGMPVIGVLKEVSKDKIVIEITTNSKKKETKTITIPFSEIKQTIVQISF